MNKKTIKGLLREALGVPENLTNLSRYVYDFFIDNLNIPRHLDVEDLNDNEDEMTLKGNFRIADYHFNLIRIKFNFIISDNVDKPQIYGMSHNYEAMITPNMTSKHVNNFDKVTLVIKIALNNINTVSQLYEELINRKNEYSSSIAHELKHAYDSYKKSETRLDKRTEYNIASDVRYGVQPIDDFIHKTYFINAIEGLVRPSEIAMAMENLGITKDNFLEFLANNKTYQSLKEINEFSVDKLKQELLADKETIIKRFADGNIPIPNSDEELVNEILHLTFTNLRNSKIKSLVNELRLDDPLFQLFGNPHPNAEKFVDDYIKKLSKFKNYHEYFAYEEKMFKFVSENLIKKIHKLYAMAKDNENVSALMQKINNKQNTNESILNWDLHYEAEKIPVTKFKKDL